MHSETFRVRDAAKLVEAWMPDSIRVAVVPKVPDTKAVPPAAGVVNPAAAAGAPGGAAAPPSAGGGVIPGTPLAAGGVVPGAIVPGAAVAGVPVPGAAGAAGSSAGGVVPGAVAPAASSLGSAVLGMSKEEVAAALKKKTKQLKKRFKKHSREGGSFNELLLGRARKKGKKKRKKSEGGSTSSTSNFSSFHEASSRSGGRELADVSREVPGSLLVGGMEQIKKLLLGRGGAAEEEVDALSAQVSTYLQSVWFGKHPEHTVNPRTVHELKMIADCLDLLLQGSAGEAADALMQRFKNLQHNHVHGEFLDELEIAGKTDLELTSATELKIAGKARKRKADLERLSKPRRRDRSPS